MTKTQKQMAVLGAVLALLIPVYGGRVMRKPSARPELAEGRAEPVPPPAAAADAVEAEPSVREDHAAQRDAQRARVAELAWGRDPFAQGGPAAGLRGLALSGILWDPAEPMAIINGELRRAGDDLGGVRVVAIAQDHVVVTDGTSTQRLFIAP